MLRACRALLCAVLLSAAAGGVSPALAQSKANYTETTVVVSANTWTPIVAFNNARLMMVLGDATGGGCVFSFNASPAAGEGFPFSLSGSPGAWPLDAPIAVNAVYVKCAATTTITVMVA